MSTARISRITAVGAIIVSLSLAATRPTAAAPVARATMWQHMQSSAATDLPIPAIITAGPDKHLWFTNTRGTIDRVTTAGAMVAFPLPHASSSPVGIAAGLDGNLWFTEADGNRLGHLTPAGAVTEYALATDGAAPAYITAGPTQSMYFTETTANKIGRISAAGVIHEYTVPTPASRLGDITAGPDGNLWFAEYAGKKIGRMTPAGTITEYPLPAGSAGPGFIATGPDGALWFTAGGDISDTSGHPTIGRITTRGQISMFALPKGAHPAGITAGPDRQIWVADSAGAILRVTTAGKWTVFPLKQTKTAAFLPLSITAGPDGNLWFTAPALCFTTTCWSQIGRITPAGKITIFSMKDVRRAASAG